MEVTTVLMPYMFSMKDDEHLDFSAPYIPMTYRDGDVCERCWLTVDIPSEREHSLTSDWLSHEVDIRPVGGEDCPHGSES